MILIIKIRIWRPRSIIWHKKLYYNVFIFAFVQKKWDADDITVLFEYLKDGIELIYVNDYKRHCYLILADFIVDYKEEVLITGIKVNK